LGQAKLALGLFAPRGACGQKSVSFMARMTMKEPLKKHAFSTAATGFCIARKPENPAVMHLRKEKRARSAALARQANRQNALGR
jgi:hypothetical protein